MEFKRKFCEYLLSYSADPFVPSGILGPVALRSVAHVCK